ncbi:MAG: M20/M25/M40 family metallo-hydrolase [Proteobacteria bacterium]|nr:M20/M25/M40 family metallo-hydrolase [Pseudomonadota bacterium]
MTSLDALAERAAAFVDDAALLSLLQRMIRFRSYSAGGEEGEIARFMQQHCRSLGLDSALQEVQTGRFNVISTLKGKGGGRSLMFNGHLDTNPAGEGWTKDPLGGVVDDKFIYGIGVSNMKAGDACFVAAVSAVKGADIPLRGDVLIAHVIGELQGGVGTVHLVKSGIRADRFIVGEPTDNQCLTMHAGSIEIELTILGKTRHLSKLEEAVDAIEIGYEAMQVLKSMTFTGPDTPDHRSVRRVGIGVIRGGLGATFEDWRPSLIADRCTIKFSARFSVGQTPETVLSDIRGEMENLKSKHPGMDYKLVFNAGGQRLFMGPFAVDRNADIVQAVADAHRRVTNSEPAIGPIGPGRFYGTDAAHLADAGMTGLVYGPGGRYNTMPDERVDLVDLYACARVYARAIVAICG